MSEWQSISLSTVDIKEDYEILDIVNITIASNTWKDTANAMDLGIDTGWLEQGTIDNLWAVASAALRKTAFDLGADAVAGCEFDIGNDSSGFFVTGFGTAVKYR